MAQYLYHRVPPKMFGNIIYPLNELKEIYPRSYHFKTMKYKGREYLLTKRIPFFDCVWNDVVFLLAANPAEVIKNIESAGLQFGTWKKFFKIPIENFDLSSMITWREYKGKYENFSRFDITNMNQYATIPQYQIKYWKHMKGRRNYLAYPYMTHLLYKGQIDITNIEIITF
jgi:hypothetical protein